MNVTKSTRAPKTGRQIVCPKCNSVATVYHFSWIRLLLPMITSKAQMLQVMKQCDGADTLTREQKFQVFVNVCDNMLAEGRISKANHTRWTEIW